MKRYLILAAGLLVLAVELLLCFTGPFALVRKPSLYPAPIYTVNMDEEEVVEMQSFLEQQLAQSETFIVRSISLLEDQQIDRGTSFTIADSNNILTWQDHLETARDLGIDRVAITLIFVSSTYVDMTVTLRDSETGEKLRSNSIKSTSLEDLKKGLNRHGEPVNISEELGLETKGPEIFDYLLFILIFLQALLLVLYLFGKKPDLLNEGTLIWGILLFSFAWIYALGANMDYVQRFIASDGNINLAESTALEQLYATLRFGPLILMNLIPWLLRVKKKWKTSSFGEKITLLGPLLAAVSAFLYGLSFPSFLYLRGHGILAWFAMVPLFLVIYYSPKGRGIIYTLFFGGLQGVIINYWHGTYSYVSLGFSTGITIAQYIPFAIILILTSKAAGKWAFLTIPGMWILFDFFRSLGFTGYPWGMIGSSQYAFTSFIQGASLFGVYGLTFIIILANTALTWLIVMDREKFQFKTPFSWLDKKLPLVLFLLIFIPNMIYGWISIIVLSRETPTDVMKTILVQQNTDPRKHSYTLSFETLVELTDKALADADGQVDLIVWPEGAFKSDIRFWTQSKYSRRDRANLVTRFMEYQRSLGIMLLTGTQDNMFTFDEEGEKVRENYNSALLLTEEGNIAQIYHKMHLVPFTESFPYEEEFPRLYKMLKTFNASNWGIGTDQTVFHHPKAVFHTPICFEDVFPQDQHEFIRRGSQVFVNISNDFWSVTPVEGMQHGIQALFRTVEFRRPMVRATASGYTVHIDRLGRIREEAADFYSPEYVISDVEIHAPSSTLYLLWGDWFCWLILGCLAIYFSLLSAQRIRKVIVKSVK